MHVRGRRTYQKDAKLPPPAAQSPMSSPLLLTAKSRATGRPTGACAGRRRFCAHPRPLFAARGAQVRPCRQAATGAAGLWLAARSRCFLPSRFLQVANLQSCLPLATQLLNYGTRSMSWIN
uniref:Uncharacterized protein n=1 Tax=Oryza punctata TaxID=4537 RepID=A0A0E0L2D3_ORYPU